MFFCHLNTLYVDIKQIGGNTTKLDKAYLNTLYVDIKPPHSREYI